MQRGTFSDTGSPHGEADKGKTGAQFELGECEMLLKGPSEMPARWLEMIPILRSQIWVHTS